MIDNTLGNFERSTLIGTGCMERSLSQKFRAGPRKIYYRRELPSPGWIAGPITPNIDGPNTEDRLRYVAALGSFEQKIPLKAREYRSLAWRGPDALEVDIKDSKRDILQRHSKLVQMLVEANLLTTEEASALPEPIIRMSIHNLRSDQKP